MNKKLRAGIIGCGGIAVGKHLISLSKYRDKVEIVAFCDIILERAENVRVEFNYPEAKVYTDYKELLKDDTIDVVYVLTPNRSHGYITVDSLNSGKHVMCEKPMAKNASEAREMVEAAKKTGKKLTIGYQSRFRKDSMYLKKLVDRGELGEIYFAKAHAVRRRAVPTWGVFTNEYEQGGGSLIDIGTHALDLTLWMMNNYEPESVMGTAFKKLGKLTETGNAWGDWDTDNFTVEDSAFGFIKMKNGATIFLESSWALNILDEQEAKTTLCGTKAGADMKDGLKINYSDMGALVVTEPSLQGKGVAFYDASSGPTEADLECLNWINCLINDTEPAVLPEQALCVTEILEAIYESNRTGKAVYFD